MGCGFFHGVGVRSRSESANGEVRVFLLVLALVV
jgi:hypothetical protein